MGRNLAMFQAFLRTATANLSALEFKYSKNLLQNDAIYLRDVYTPNKETLLHQADGLLAGPPSDDKDAVLDWINANADAYVFLTRPNIWGAVKDKEILDRRKNAEAVLDWIGRWIDLYKNKADVLLEEDGSPKDLTNAEPDSDQARQRDKRDRLNSTRPWEAQPVQEAQPQEKKAPQTLGARLADIKNGLNEADPAETVENLRMIGQYISDYDRSNPGHRGLGTEAGKNVGLLALDTIEAIAEKYPNNGEIAIRCGATATALSQQCENDPDFKKNAVEKNKDGISRVNKLLTNARPFAHKYTNPLIRNAESYSRLFSLMFDPSAFDPTPLKDKCKDFLKNIIENSIKNSNENGIENVEDPLFALYAIKTISERFPDDNQMLVDCRTAAKGLIASYNKAPDTAKGKTELKNYLDSIDGRFLANSLEQKAETAALSLTVSSVNARLEAINREMEQEMAEFLRRAAALEKVSRHDSEEYKNIIKTLKAVAQPFNPLKDGDEAALKLNNLTDEQIKAGKYAFVHAKISEYLDHKARKGVNRNAFEKLAAVEELNQYVSDKIRNHYRVPVTFHFTDRLGKTKNYHYPNDCFQTYHEEVTAGKMNNEYLVDTETKLNEISADVTATGKNFAYSQVEKIKKVADCMDRIMLRVQDTQRDAIRNRTRSMTKQARSVIVQKKFLKEFVDVKKSFSTDPTMSPLKQAGGRAR